MAYWYPQNSLMEQNGGLFDAVLEFDSAIDMFHEKLSEDRLLSPFKKIGTTENKRTWKRGFYSDFTYVPAQIEVDGIVISHNDDCEWKFQHPHYVVEFFTDGGECWVEARGLSIANHRAQFIEWLNGWSARMNQIEVVTLRVPVAGNLVLV